MKFGHFSLTLSIGVVLPILGIVGDVQAATISITVPGTSDPWLAGLPNGSEASLGDIAPAQSPVPVVGLPLSSSVILTFSVTGSVNFAPSPSSDPPDGSFVISHATGAENGISDVTAPANSLLGIFLSSDRPDSTLAPSSLSFDTAASRDFLTLDPDLKQVFFVGDGLTSGGDVQKFFVPTGATRLFLGTMDGFGWYDNSGQFDVRVKTQAVPEPASVLGTFVAVSAFCLKLRQKRV